MGEAGGRRVYNVARAIQVLQQAVLREDVLRELGTLLGDEVPEIRKVTWPLFWNMHLLINARHVAN